MVSVVNLAVGKELLIGRTLNTNAYWIGGRLYRMGGMLDRILTVADSLDDISSGLNELLADGPDFIIVVGGLGPTPDDMTLKGVAKGLGKKVKVDERALALIKEHLVKVGRDPALTPERRKMATLPEGGVPLANELGTAPGVRLASRKTVIFCLPGVPREMRNIFTNFVEKEVRTMMGTIHSSRITMKIAGVYEAPLAPALAEALQMHPDAYIKSHPRGLIKGVPNLELDVTVTSAEMKKARSAHSELVSFLTAKISELGGTISIKRKATT